MYGIEENYLFIDGHLGINNNIKKELFVFIKGYLCCRFIQTRIQMKNEDKRNSNVGLSTMEDDHRNTFNYL